MKQDRFIVHFTLGATLLGLFGGVGRAAVDPPPDCPASDLVPNKIAAGWNEVPDPDSITELAGASLTLELTNTTTRDLEVELIAVMQAGGERVEIALDNATVRHARPQGEGAMP